MEKKMCEKMKGHCFSDEEKQLLTNLGWDEKQILFVEDSIVEDKVKNLLYCTTVHRKHNTFNELMRSKEGFN